MYRRAHTSAPYTYVLIYVLHALDIHRRPTEVASTASSRVAEVVVAAAAVVVAARAATAKQKLCSI